MLTRYYCKAYCKHNVGSDCKLDFTTIDVNGCCIGFEERES